MYVKVRDDSEESLTKALQIFNKKVKEAGIIQECKARREYLKPSLKKRLKREEAHRRRLREERKVHKK
jgi:small subunit ribosomal protein S21